MAHHGQRWCIGVLLLTAGAGCMGVFIPGLLHAQTTTTELIPYLDANWLYGFADASGKLVIPARYEIANRFKEGRAAVMDVDGKWGYIDQAGRWIVSPRYNSADDFSGGSAVAKIETPSNAAGTGGAGLIASPSIADMLLPWRHEEYTTMYRFDTTGRRVGKWRAGDNKHAMQPDTKGRGLSLALAKLLRTPTYQTAIAILPPLDAYYPIYLIAQDCKRNHDSRPFADLYVGPCHVGFFAASGRALTPFLYEPLEQTVSKGFVSDRLLVKRDGKWGFIDSQGTEAIPCEFDQVTPFLDGYAAVVKKGKGVGFIDTQGLMIVDFEEGFDNLSSLAGAGYFIGHRASGWGIFDLTHRREVVPFKYAKPGDLAIFSYGTPRSTVVATRDDAQGWCVLDKQGNSSHCGYKQMLDANDGVIAVQDTSGLWGALDTNGQWLFSPRYRRSFTYYGGLAVTPRTLPKPPQDRSVDHLHFIYMDTHGHEYAAPSLLAEPQNPQ